jgi:DNA-directed RNA polymerase subunit RPC12/RpoP
MKVIDFFRSKIIIFIIQILILSLLIFYFRYYITINFDTTVSIPQKGIIQFLANYVLFNNLSGMIFIYLIWIIVSFIPTFLYNNFKRAYSMNLMTFFFPNFFVNTFLYKHSVNYFNSNFLFHFLHSILIGLLITAFSLFISISLKKIRKVKTIDQLQDLKIIANQIKSKCPKCGTKFDSTPIFCYNCNTKLILKPEENVGFR